MTDDELEGIEFDLRHFVPIVMAAAHQPDVPLDGSFWMGVGFLSGTASRLLEELRRTRNPRGLLQAEDAGGAAALLVEGPVREGEPGHAQEVPPSGQTLGKLGPER